MGVVKESDFLRFMCAKQAGVFQRKKPPSKA